MKKGKCIITDKFKREQFDWKNTLIKKCMKFFSVLTLAGVCSVGSAFADDSVSLQSAEINLSNHTLKVSYSKNFNACAHLKRANNTITNQSNPFCGQGEDRVVTTSLSEFADINLGESLKLCHGNVNNVCSELVEVTEESPFTLNSTSLDLNGKLNISYTSSVSDCLTSNILMERL